MFGLKISILEQNSFHLIKRKQLQKKVLFPKLFIFIVFVSKKIPVGNGNEPSIKRVMVIREPVQWVCSTQARTISLHE